LPKTGIVIPCYQEAKRLPETEYTSFFYKYPEIYFLFVNDGSKDETLNVLNRLKLKGQGNGNIEVLDFKYNSGKAESIRLGINHILTIPDIRYVGFLDADLATPFDEFLRLLEMISNHTALKMVSGARIKRMGAAIERSSIRHYISRIIATITTLGILRIPVYDTQCGAKIFDAEFAHFIFQDQFISRWLFDIEIYCRIIAKCGYEETLEFVYELPLNTWHHVKNSKIGLTEAGVLLDLLKIYYRYSLKKTKKM